MLDIYASTFMTATRTDNTCVREVIPTDTTKRRWFTRRKTICVDLSKL